MNSPSCSIPDCDGRPVSEHQRRNSAIEPAYALVVDSAPSRPNRTCRRNESATATTASSSSSTVQYLAPDGILTGNARIPDPRSRADLHKQLPATSTTPEETRRRTLPYVPFRQRHATSWRPPENPAASGRAGAAGPPAAS